LNRQAAIAAPSEALAGGTEKVVGGTTQDVRRQTDRRDEESICMCVVSLLFASAMIFLFPLPPLFLEDKSEVADEREETARFEGRYDDVHECEGRAMNRRRM